MYLVDGAQNINRMDGGYALKLPVEAIAEFRILTQSAPPEYGGTGGATTSVVTRSGGNQFHGGLYEFLRNDAFDARNFFSEKVEPLRQHQFGATIGGPITRDKLLFFGYYEGFRNTQGATTTATVPTPQERQGDFSGMGTPLINFAAGGTPIPGNIIPDAAINPVSRNVMALYPLGNVSPSIYRATLVGSNELDSAGGRVDFTASPNDQIFGRYSVLRRPQYQPDLDPGHRRAGLPDARRHLDARRHGVEHAHLLAVAHQFPARHRAAPRLLLRSAPEPDAAERARVRLRLVERSRSGAAVLQHQRLHADWRRDHRSSQHDAEHLRDPGQPRVDERLAPREGRRRDPAHRDRHDPGDCAECVLRLRQHVPDEQRHREPAARLPGDLLSGAGRFQPGDPALECRRVRAGRMARRPAGHAELRPSLRAHQPVHGNRGSAERLRAGREVAGQARRACRAAVSGRSGNREGDRAELQTRSCPASAWSGIRPGPACGR